MRTMNYDQAANQIDAGLEVALKIIIAIFFIIVGILSFLFAVAITAICVVSLGLKTLLWLVLSRRLTAAAYALASGGQSV